MTVTPRYRVLDTPTGPFALIEDPDGSLRTGWIDSDWTDPDDAVEDPTMLEDLARRLAAYFRGEAADFSDVPTPDGSPFLKACWDACRTIEPGATRSYGELSVLAGGTTGGARAAGQAMRRNPLPVIVPCHRVIGAGGDLHGFAGSQERGGDPLTRKATLLEMEKAVGTTTACLAEDR